MAIVGAPCPAYCSNSCFRRTLSSVPQTLRPFGTMEITLPSTYQASEVTAEFTSKSMPFPCYDFSLYSCSYFASVRCSFQVFLVHDNHIYCCDKLLKAMLAESHSTCQHRILRKHFTCNRLERRMPLTTNNPGFASTNAPSSVSMDTLLFPNS